jgi:hypothetical protein
MITPIAITVFGIWNLNFGVYNPSTVGLASRQALMITPIAITVFGIWNLNFGI